MSDVTPERLAELADGATPETGAERDAVALMAEVRGLAEPAPDAVRERVGGIAAAGAPAAGRWAGGWRRLALAGAPVAAAVVALAIAIPVLTRDDDGGSQDVPAAAADRAAPMASGAAEGAAGGGEGATAPTGPEAQSPPPAAAAAPSQADTLRAQEPGPGEARLRDGVAARVVRARAALEEAGATGVRTEPSADGATATLVAEVPAGAVEAATRALEEQGARVTTTAFEGGAIVRATVTTGG